jgi:hypothetical protein
MLLIYLNCPFLIAPSLFSNVCKVKNKPKTNKQKEKKKNKNKNKNKPEQYRKQIG